MLIRASTFSKDGRAWGLPWLRAERYDGARLLCRDIRDDTTRWYVDWTSALGQNLFGQTVEFKEYYQSVVAAYGLCSTLVHDLEYEVAENLAGLLAGHVPGWAGVKLGVRFVNDGSSATEAAVRLARAVTAREAVVTYDGMYHGWHDWTQAREVPAWGVPKCLEATTVCRHKAPALELGAGEADRLPRWGVERETNRLINHLPACVVFEHPPEAPPDGWVNFLNGFCKRNGILLVADEVVTWPRCGPGGASGLWGYEPDLICLGKALGNGAKVAALVGPLEYMKWFDRKDPVFVSSTAAGNPADLAAAGWVLDRLTMENVDRLWYLGQAVMEDLAAGAHLDVRGHPPRSVVRWEDKARRAYFIKGMADRGHLVNRPYFPNLALTDGDVGDLGRAAVEVVTLMAGMDRAYLQAAGQPWPEVLFEDR